MDLEQERQKAKNEVILYVLMFGFACFGAGYTLAVLLFLLGVFSG